MAKVNDNTQIGNGCLHPVKIKRSLFNSGLCSIRKIETPMWRRERMFKSIKSSRTLHTGYFGHDIF